jgi:UDP-glucose 4-epimerase
MDVIFHLAASVGNTRSIEEPIADSEVNLLGTIRVLESARKAGVGKVVFSSSAAIFGELKSLPIAEDHPVLPDSPYGVSKLAAEKMCLAYARLHGLQTICLRYFNVYGSNQRYDAYGNVIPIFAQRLLSRQPLQVFGDGGQTRDFVSVRDVAYANLLAAKTDGVSTALNIGSGMAITINRLIDLMSSAFGLKAVLEHCPPRKGDVYHSCANIALAREVLGYEPRVQIDAGLAEYLGWAKGEISGCAELER